MRTRTPRLTAALVAAGAVGALTLSAVVPGASAQAGGSNRNGGAGGSSSSPGGSQTASGLDVIGLVDGSRLVRFNESSPGSVRTVGFIGGLTGDSRILGIDFRPATGELFALGNAGGIYAVSATDASAVKMSQLSVALTSASVAIDFNPTVDRLRIIGGDGQNLRVNVDTGAATVDGTLNYTAGTTATGVVAAAYTNNDADPSTATTLFDIDASLDQVVIQAPPNAGPLNPTGKLGRDASAPVGFDIHSSVPTGTTTANTGLATLRVGGKLGLYRIDLLSGRASASGPNTVGANVIDIAIPLDR